MSDVGNLEIPITVIVLDDPEWSPALEALEHRGDAKDIAALLCAEKPMPSWVGQRLGVMLAPTDDYRGVTLKAKVPSSSRTARARMEQVRKWVEIRKMVTKKKEEYDNLESAVNDVSKQLKLSRKAIFAALRYDEKQAVFEHQKLLGNVREPKWLF